MPLLSQLANKDYTYLVDGYPYDPEVADEVNIRMATRHVFFDANDPDRPNTVYRGICTQALTCSRGFMGREVPGGVALPTFAAVVATIGDESAALRARVKDLRHTGHSVVVRRGVKGESFSTFGTLLDGQYTQEPSFEKMRIVWPCADISAMLDKPFQSATYGGTGGFDGGSDLKGAYKQDWVGINRGVPVVWVDPANGWTDVCASGFHTVYGVYDGADLVTADVSNPPAVGKYYVDSANGRLRFGSPPVKQYRVDFRSNFNSGSIRPGAIVSAILTRAGYVSGRLDSASFTNFDTARPYDVGWGCPGGETFRTLIDSLIYGLLGFLTQRPSDGKVTLGFIRPPVSVAPTDATVAAVITDRDILPGTLKRNGGKAPPARLDVQGRKNWQVLTDDQIASLADDADKQFARNEFRTVPKDNSDTADAFPNAVPMSWPTPIDDLTHLSTFGDTAADVITNPWPDGEVTVACGPFAMDLGAEVWVRSTVNEIDAPAIVADIDENADANQVRLKFAFFNG